MIFKVKRGDAKSGVLFSIFSTPVLFHLLKLRI